MDIKRNLAKLLTSLLPVSKARRKVLCIKLRSWLYIRGLRKRVKFGRDIRIERKCEFTPGSEVGDRSKVTQIHVYGMGKVKIGKNCRLSWGLRVHTSNHDYHGEFLPFGDGNVIKDVEIGDFVWIGSDVLLLPGTKIGEGSIIQGGSVVHGVIPPCSIAGGNPAKVFATRDAEKFAHLKAEGRFLPHTKGWDFR